MGYPLMKINFRMFLVFLIFGFLTSKMSTIHASQTMLALGRVQFPSTIQRLPSLRMYYSGSIIDCEPDADGKYLSFALPKSPTQRKFYLLVAEAISFELVKSLQPDFPINTAEYCKVERNAPYRLFELELVEEKAEEKDQKQASKTHAASTFSWHVNEHMLIHEDQRIPDMTIIMLYNPNFVDTLKGGTAFELPTIHLKKNLIELAGSEKKLHELSDALLINSLDSDALHNTIEKHVKVDNYRALVAAPIA